jgi:hypothetical protein
MVQIADAGSVPETSGPFDRFNERLLKEILAALPGET